jgi:hypothetical protein
MTEWVRPYDISATLPGGRAGGKEGPPLDFETSIPNVEGPARGPEDG